MPDQVDMNSRINKIHQNGLVDMHFDMLMDLYEKRGRENVLQSDYLPDLQRGDVGVLGVAIYLLEQYLPEQGTQVALDQIALLYKEIDQTGQLVICGSNDELLKARREGKIAVLITMEGVEPLGGDIHLLRIFYELGLRSLSLTHARRNAAADGAALAQSGSSNAGLTSFGRQVIQECERLGVIIDLAHLNQAGFDEVMDMVTRPAIISHTNVRRYYDFERNSSDEQIRMVVERGGVVGVSSVLVSQHEEKINLDHFVDHIMYMVDLAGIDGVGLGFDFFKFIYDTLPVETKNSLPEVHFIPDLHNHAHTPNLTRKLFERGFNDQDVEKILHGNFMRVLGEWL